MEFSEGENVLFRHLGMHNKKEGDVIVTNLRLVFVPNDAPQEMKSLVWANIEKVEYSPPTNLATAMKVTTVQGSELLVIQLIRGKNEVRLNEFQNMKNIITNAKKASSTVSSTSPATSSSSIAATTAAVHATPSSSSSSTSQPAVARATSSATTASSSSVSMTPTERLRQQMLQNNEALQKLYKELVVDNCIISEEDFWNTHQEALQIEESKSISTKKQGMANALWTDIIKETPDGKKKIVLTPEKREIIFHLFPHVRLAFEKEVPLNYTEAQFWKKFLDAEYHKGIQITSGPRRANDPLFSKYLSDAKDVVSNLVEQAKRKQKFERDAISCPEVDLTTSFGDSKRKELLDEEDRVKNIDDETRYVERKNLIAIKAFQESVALIKADSDNTTKKTVTSGITDKIRTDCEELKRTKLPTYIPVDLTSVNNGGPQSTIKSGKDAALKENVVVQYSGSTYKRKFDWNALKTAEESGYLAIRSGGDNEQELPEKKKAKTKEMESRANKLFSDEVSRLQLLDETTSIGENNTRRDELPSAMSKELSETYRGITELLCHFYAILHRGIIDEATKKKLLAIMEKLKLKYKDPLEAKKRNISTGQQYVRLIKVQKDHLLSVINGHVELIKQANYACDAAVNADLE